MNEPWQQKVAAIGNAVANSGLTCSEFARRQKISRQHLTRILLVYRFLDRPQVNMAGGLLLAYHAASDIRDQMRQKDLEKVLDRARQRQEGADD